MRPCHSYSIYWPSGIQENGRQTSVFDRQWPRLLAVMFLWHQRSSTLDHRHCVSQSDHCELIEERVRASIQSLLFYL